MGEDYDSVFEEGFSAEKYQLGAIKVGIRKATNLPDGDDHSAGGFGFLRRRGSKDGRTNAYVEYYMPSLSRAGRHRTDVRISVRGTGTDPSWEDDKKATHVFPLVRELDEVNDDVLEVSVWEKHKFADDFIGRGTVALNLLQSRRKIDNWCDLTGRDGLAEGQVLVRLHYKNPKDKDGKDQKGDAKDDADEQQEGGSPRAPAELNLAGLPELPETQDDDRVTENRGDWQVQVSVIQVRGLMTEDANSYVRPYVVVGVAGAQPETATGGMGGRAAMPRGEQRPAPGKEDTVSRCTALKEGRQAWFDEQMSFVVRNPLRSWWARNITADVRALVCGAEGKEEVSVGTASFPFADIWRQPGHEYFRRWVAITPSADDLRVRGYVQLSVSVLGPKDGFPEHAAKEADDAAEQQEAIMPRRAVLNRVLLTFSIFRAEGIPQMDMNVLSDIRKGWGGEKADKADPFVTVSFGNRVRKTNPIFSEYRPEWFKRLHLPVCVPTFAESIQVQMLDHNQVGGPNVIATHFLDWSRLTRRDTELPRLGARWINFYGAPRDFQLISHNIKRGLGDSRMNRGRALGVAYRGRLLLELKSSPILDKNEEAEDPGGLSEDVPRQIQPRFRINQYTVKCRVLFGAMFPSNYKYKVEVSIGEYYAHTQPRRAQWTDAWRTWGVDDSSHLLKASHSNWSAEWYEELELHTRWEAIAAQGTDYGRQTHLMPDVIITLLDDSNNRVGFTRFDSSALLRECFTEQVRFRDADPDMREFGGDWQQDTERLHGAHVMLKLPVPANGSGLLLFVCDAPFSGGTVRRRRVNPAARMERSASGYTTPYTNSPSDSVQRRYPFAADAPVRVRRVVYSADDRMLTCYFRDKEEPDEPWINFTLPRLWQWHEAEILSSDHFRGRSLTDLLAALWRLCSNAGIKREKMTWKQKCGYREVTSPGWPELGNSEEHVSSVPRTRRRGPAAGPRGQSEDGRDCLVCAHTIPVQTLLTACDESQRRTDSAITGFLVARLGLFCNGAANPDAPPDEALRPHRFDGPMDRLSAADGGQTRTWAQEYQRQRELARNKSAPCFPVRDDADPDAMWAGRELLQGAGGPPPDLRPVAQPAHPSSWVVLRAFIYRAVDLRAGDADGLADPYVRVCFGGQVAETVYYDNTLNPTFNETLELLVRIPAWQLYGVPPVVVEVWDHDAMTDDCLGRAICPLVHQYAQADSTWVELKPGDSDIPELEAVDLTLPSGRGGYAGRLICSFHLAAAQFAGEGKSVKLQRDLLSRHLADPEPAPRGAHRGGHGLQLALSSVHIKRLPQSLKPLSYDAQVDVFLLGVRELAPYLKIPIVRPNVTFEIDSGVTGATPKFDPPVSKHGRGPNHNFLQTFTIQTELPLDLRYLPALVVKVHDDRSITRVLAGSATVPLLALIPGGVSVRYRDWTGRERLGISGMYYPWGPMYNDAPVWHRPGGRYVLYRRRGGSGKSLQVSWVIARRMAGCVHIYGLPQEPFPQEPCLYEKHLSVVAALGSAKLCPVNRARARQDWRDSEGRRVEVEVGDGEEVTPGAPGEVQLGQQQSGLTELEVAGILSGLGATAMDNTAREARRFSTAEYSDPSDSSGDDAHLRDLAMSVHCPPGTVAAIRAKRNVESRTAMSFKDQCEQAVRRPADDDASPFQQQKAAPEGDLFYCSASDDDDWAHAPRDPATSSRRLLGHLKNDPAEDPQVQVLDDSALLGGWLKALAGSSRRKTVPKGFRLGMPLEELHLHSPRQGRQKPKGFDDTFKTFTLMRGRDDSWRSVGSLRALVSAYPVDLVQAALQDGEGLNVAHASQCALRFGRVRSMALKDTRVMVYVYVVRCTDLKRMDWAITGGSSDPYLDVSIGRGGSAKPADSRNFQKDGVHFGVLEPEFMQAIPLSGMLPRDRELRVAVWDYDVIGRDELIGYTTINLEDRFFSRRFQCDFLWNKRMNVDILEGLEDKDGQKVRSTWPYACHIERRPLYNPNKSSMVETGYIEMWVDIVPDVGPRAPMPPGPWQPPAGPAYAGMRVPRLGLEPDDPASFQVVNLAFPEPERYELRVILWNARNVYLQDTNIFGERMSDIMIKAFIPGSRQRVQESDVHHRSKDGVGNFNWRFKFPIVYVRHEQKIIPDPESHKWRLFHIRQNPKKTAPVLHVQIFDSDLLPFTDDLIGEVKIPLGGTMKGATDDGYLRPLGLFRRLRSKARGRQQEAAGGQQGQQPGKEHHDEYVFGERMTPKVWFPCYTAGLAGVSEQEDRAYAEGDQQTTPGCMRTFLSALCSCIICSLGACITPCFDACRSTSQEHEEQKAVQQRAKISAEKAKPQPTEKMVKQDLRYRGEVQLSFQLVEWEKSQQDEYKAGYGRSEPNANPVLQEPARPEDSFLWWQHPLKSFKFILYENWKPYCAALLCCILCVIFIGLLVWFGLQLAASSAGGAE